MGVDWTESRRSRSVEMRDRDDTPMRERRTADHDDLDENGSEERRDSGKHRSKDKSKSSGRREEKDHRSRDQEKLKEREREDKDLDRDRDHSSRRDRRREDRDEREKDKTRDRGREKDDDHEKHREKEREKERKDRGKEKDRERERDKDMQKDGERGRDKEREKEKSRDKDKEREKEKERERTKDRDKEKQKDGDRERENGRDRDRGKDVGERERGNERSKEKEKPTDQEKERTRDRERSSHKQRDESHDKIKDLEPDDYVRAKQSVKGRSDDSDYEPQVLKRQQNAEIAGSHQSAVDLEERIAKMREERLKKSEASSEVLSWVNRSRKLDEKRNAEKEKAMQLSKMFEEQDNLHDEESDEEATAEHVTDELDGVKVLHGLDKVLEGGTVVLTLKDQSILAEGDINQEVDMLENVEIGEQKRRDEAYKASKKKTGVYDDKFNDEPGVEKKMLPQYDDPMTDEGVTLNAMGRLTAEAERKLEELRKRLQGSSASRPDEDLNPTAKISTDYYTEEEMMKFKKPKKKKSLRKREKLDVDALEAEALSAGLTSTDLGSRKDGKRQNLREEQEKIDAEMRSNAFQSAVAKANEATKMLLSDQARNVQTEEEDSFAFGDDDDELRKSLDRARKIALKKQEEENSVPQTIALLTTSIASGPVADNPNSGSAEMQEEKFIITEMEEFVSGLQLGEEAQKPESEDVFMEEDEAPSTSEQEMKDEDGGWTEVKEAIKDETQITEKEEEVAPDTTIHESALGKGIGAALKLMKERGMLKETVEWGGRNMDKKKSKLVGIHENDGPKQINIERTDEYGRVLTPKEAFRLLSHKFHGKGPGKMKQEKRMRQYQEELKIKQMKNDDTPSLSVERMREAQAKLQTPYLVLSGHVKPGQSSDPRSGFATLEKDFGGSLTPMLGDKKVEHFLNIKRKPEGPGDTPPQKKPKS